MVTKEDINKLAATLSEVSKTLHHAAETISALGREIAAETPGKVDRFKAKTSLNDTISQPEPAIALRQPVRDIAKAITINDRMLFIRELFGGDAALFAQTISELNRMTGLDDAKSHLQSVLPHWDGAAEPAQLFLSILQRRYL
jgi:hypothetical protein